MSTMTITIERTPRKVMKDGQMIEVEELSIRLPFARKPENLSALGGEGLHRVWVTETRVLSPQAFDEFARHLLKSRDWLDGQGGGKGDAYFCVEVCAPGRPYLYVNPEGSDYGRYVAAIFSGTVKS
jgi:hypothetical protein